MDNKLTINDVILTAVAIEQKGVALYQRFIDQSDDGHVKQLFTFLRDEEVEHCDVFRSMLRNDEADSILKEEVAPARAIEIDTLLHQHLFFRDDFVIPEEIHEDVALHMALEFEKESMLFFCALKELVSEDEQQLVDACVEEERTHILKIQSFIDGEY